MPQRLPENPRAPLACRRAARWPSCLAAGFALLAGAGRVAGQVIPEPLVDPFVPAGRVRVDFTPTFTTWDSRYGPHLENGLVVNGEEPLGADLSDPERIFPGIANLRQSVRALTGESGYVVRVGDTYGRVTKDVKRIDTGIRLGVFDWLTLGVTVPYVKTRATIDLGFVPDPAANVGANPNAADPDAVSTLLADLERSATAAADRAASLCGAGDPGCTAAQDLADRVGAFRTRTRTAYLTSPVFPTASSPVAAALSGALASLDGELTAAGLEGVSASMPFASAILEAEGFAALAEDPSVRAAPLETAGEGLWTLGDVELTAALRLLEGEVRDSAAVSPRFAWMLWGGALVRLGTGTVDDPAVAFDTGSGDGQMDVEGRLDGALRVGAHFDLHGTARYGVQGSGTLFRRVALHERVFPPVDTRRVVRWTPGDYLFVELSPRWHLGEALALAVDLRRYHKAEDAYEIVAGQLDGLLPVSTLDLEHETEMTLREIAIGIRYSTLALWREGRTGAPMEFGARVVRATGGSGGQAPNSTRVEFSASVFRRLWGRR